jgi:hypothetical protein
MDISIFEDVVKHFRWRPITRSDDVNQVIGFVSVESSSLLLTEIFSLLMNGSPFHSSE